MKVRSLLDIDFYKITQQQLAWKNFPNLKVKFQFKNRTDIDISKFVSDTKIREELQETRGLRYMKDEIIFLENTGRFDKKFLEYLEIYKLPDITVEPNGDIHTTGYWKDAILWETIVLSTVNELYYQEKYSTKEITDAEVEGLIRLRNKLDILKKNNIRGISDFGTRRRFSAEWHDFVVSQIKNHPSFIGTSNVYLAKKYGLQPIGTNAHEMYMIAAGYYGHSDDDNLKSSHSFIMNQWYHMFGYDLSIGLTDTFGSKFFFKDFVDKALKWKGVRHDSGDPFKFGETVIDFYNDHLVDPMTKFLIFSDGLDLSKILKLDETFKERINYGYGWGTKLTNDLGFETLSIVMKAVEVISDGDVQINRTLVKLSDNLNKSQGDESEVERYARVFDYDNIYSEKLEV